MSRDYTPLQQHLVDLSCHFSKYKLIARDLDSGTEVVTYDPDCKEAEEYPNLHYLFHEELLDIVRSYGEAASVVLKKTESNLKAVIMAYPSLKKDIDETLFLWYVGSLDRHFYYNTRNNELLKEYIIKQINSRKEVLNGVE